MAICEAIVEFSAVTGVISTSFNVTSITVVGGSAPYSQVNFTNPISTSTYIALCTAGNGGVDGLHWLSSGPLVNAPTTTSFSIWNGTNLQRVALAFNSFAVFTN